MRIVIVNRHPSDFLGGSEIQCDNIATELTKRGHVVVYVVPGGDVSRYYGTNYRVIPVEANAQAIASTAIDLKPDVVYWRLNRYMLFRAAKKMKKAGLPIVFAISHIRDTKLISTNTNPLAGSKQFKLFCREIISSAYNYIGFRYVSAVSSLNPEFLDRIPVKTQRFIPNSVSEVSRPFTWPRPYVVWIANLKPQKRPQLYLELADRLRGTGVDFLMFGSIQASEYKGIGDNGPSNFHYMGPCAFEDGNGIIRGSQLLVHTCKPEGFGNNFIQAWLAGRPTVTLGFDPGGYIERENLGGSAKDDFDVFVGMVKGLLSSDIDRHCAGERARKFAQENFSIDKTVSELELLIRETIENYRCETTRAKA